MPIRIAVLNAGTATVKAALAEVSDAADPGVRVLANTSVECRSPEGFETAFRSALDRIVDRSRPPDAVAHRVVHGGLELTGPRRIDGAVERAIERLVELAPLHNPPALEGIRIARRELPDVPAVAVFDSGFHAERPQASRVYALPWELVQGLSLYRYGFHGIAHASLVESLAREEGRPLESIAAVTLQLGSGCSACAVEGGRSVETSMGFTPLEGLPMATRSGDVDPGVIFHLLRRGHSADELEDLLNRGSGLRGLAGSADAREVLRAETEGDERAALALAVFVRRIVATVGAYLTLLGGRGSLVFGGGIGENAPEIRRRVAAGLGAWDIALDPERNEAGGPGRISPAGSRGVHVFESREEPLIARAAAAVIRGSAARRH